MSPEEVGEGLAGLLVLAFVGLAFVWIGTLIWAIYHLVTWITG